MSSFGLVMGYGFSIAFPVTIFVQPKTHIATFFSNESSKAVADHALLVLYSVTLPSTFGFWEMVNLVWHSFNPSLQAFRMSFRFREPRIFPYIVLWRLAQMDGYLRWNRFVVLERN